MRILRFNESFNSEQYLDYLLSEVDEEKISFKDSCDFFLYVEYDISSEEAYKIDKYINVNPRFSDVIVISKYDLDVDYHRILLVDRFFYSRNQSCLYKNIKWAKHPISIEMDKILSLNIDISRYLPRHQRAEKAINIPENISVIRNLDMMGQVEIWNKKEVDTVKVWESDTPQLQYLLFKYLGK